MLQSTSVSSYSIQGSTASPSDCQGHINYFLIDLWRCLFHTYFMCNIRRVREMPPFYLFFLSAAGKVKNQIGVKKILTYKFCFTIILCCIKLRPRVVSSHFFSRQMQSHKISLISGRLWLTKLLPAAWKQGSQQHRANWSELPGIMWLCKMFCIHFIPDDCVDFSGLTTFLVELKFI